MKNRENLKFKLDKKLFWDTKYKDVDVDKHADFIIKRVLNFGDLSDYLVIKELYGIKKIKEIAAGSIFQNNKTLNFWSKILKIKCIQKQSTKKQSAFSKRLEV